MDPEEDMVCLFFTQYMPGAMDMIGKFQTLAYQAVVE